LHFKNIFNDSELLEILVADIFPVTASDGKSYQVKHYNLDAIIAVGYRVNSKRATAFCHRANGSKAKRPITWCFALSISAKMDSKT